MKLVLIRHGATPANAVKAYLGKTDETLSETGREEIYYKKAAGIYPRADLIGVSPMKRCQETKDIIYGDQPSIIIPKWKEMNFGLFEGKNYKDLQGNPDYQKWIDSNGRLPFPQGESREEFIHRCMEGWEEFYHQIERMKQKDTNQLTAVMIVHGGTIMAILSTLTNRDYYDFMCDNGSGFIYETKEQGEICLDTISSAFS